MPRPSLSAPFLLSVSAATTLALSACQPAPSSLESSAPAAPAPESAPVPDAGQAVADSESPVVPGYRARGNEPGWLVTIDGGQLAVNARYGELQVAGPAPEPEPDAEGRRVWNPAIEGVRVTLTTRPGPCRDSMTGMPYPDHAVLVLDGESLPGCGGEPRDLLAGMDWRVAAIGGEPILAGSHVDIRFDGDGRVGGAGSCNRYTTGYTLTGEGLHLGPIAGTLMACDQPLMDQERRLHEALATVVRFDIADEGDLLLIADDDAVGVRELWLIDFAVPALSAVC